MDDEWVTHELVAGILDRDADAPEIGGDDEVEGIPLTRYVWQVGGTGETWEDDDDAV